MVKINSDGLFRVNFNQENSQPNNTQKIKGIRSYCWLTSLFVGMRTTIYTYKDPSSHKTYYLNAKSIERWINEKNWTKTSSEDSAQQGQSVSQNPTLVFTKRVFFASKSSNSSKTIHTIALNALQSDPAKNGTQNQTLQHSTPLNLNDDLPLTATPPTIPAKPATETSKNDIAENGTSNNPTPEVLSPATPSPTQLPPPSPTAIAPEVTVVSGDPSPKPHEPQPNESLNEVTLVQNYFSAIHPRYTFQKNSNDKWQVKFRFSNDDDRNQCIKFLNTEYKLGIDIALQDQKWRLGDAQICKELILSFKESLKLSGLQKDESDPNATTHFNQIMDKIKTTVDFVRALEKENPFNEATAIENIKKFEQENQVVCVEGWIYVIKKSDQTFSTNIKAFIAWYQKTRSTQDVNDAIKKAANEIIFGEALRRKVDKNKEIKALFSALKEITLKSFNVKDLLLDYLQNKTNPNKTNPNPKYPPIFAELLLEYKDNLTAENMALVAATLKQKVDSLTKRGMQGCVEALEYITNVLSQVTGDPVKEIKTNAEAALKAGVTTMITRCANTNMALERIGMFLEKRSVTIGKNSNNNNPQLWFECPTAEDREKLVAQCQLIEGCEINQDWQKVDSNPPGKFILKLSSNESFLLLGLKSLDDEYFIDLMKSMEAIYKIQPIASDYTAITPLETQRKAHEDSKTNLSTQLQSIGGTFMPISPTKMEGTIPLVAGVNIEANNLPEDVVSWKITTSVQNDIKAASSNEDGPYEIFQVASQANGCEAQTQTTITPGRAWDAYMKDGTQGPQAQMAFGRQQVEIVNVAGNLGFNSLVHVFDQNSIGQVKHGYCTPTNDTQAQAMIQQISQNYEKLEYSYIKNTPFDEDRSVGQFLSFAPAFGRYSQGTISADIRNQLEFSVALMSYRALFQTAINGEKPCIVNAAGIGLGVFENNPENVAKAFYVAIQEYKELLASNKVQVKLNLYESELEGVTQAGTMASYLTGLKNDGKTFGEVFQDKSEHGLISWRRKEKYVQGI